MSSPQSPSRAWSLPSASIASRPTRGRRIELPVTGVFVLAGGKIARFSDYFDLASFEHQSGMKL